MAAQQSMRYMFVDCPTPQKAKLERGKGSKSRARAHVTKEFHRRVRIERLQVFKQQRSPTLPTPVLEVAEVKKEAISPDGIEDVAPSLQVMKQDAEDGSESAVILRDTGNKFIWSMLSQSRSDPFNCLPVQDLPKYMQRVLDHGKHRSMCLQRLVLINASPHAYLACDNANERQSPRQSHQCCLAEELHGVPGGLPCISLCSRVASSCRNERLRRHRVGC